LVSNPALESALPTKVNFTAERVGCFWHRTLAL